MSPINPTVRPHMYSTQVETTDGDAWYGARLEPAYDSTAPIAVHPDGLQFVRATSVTGLRGYTR